jgi:hypothetical protein
MSRPASSKNIATFVVVGLAAVFGSRWSIAQTETDDLKPAISSRFHVERGTTAGFVIVKVVIPEGNHIYGLSQAEPLTASKFSLKESKKYRLAGKFKSDVPPKVVENDEVFEIRVDKHSGTVQFYAPIELTSGVDPTNLHIEVLFSGQICSDMGFCMPIRNQSTSARFEGYFDRQATESNNQRRR